jgi:hypothetical protein
MLRRVKSAIVINVKKNIMLTQHELIIKWCKEHGHIIPAKMAGTVYCDVMFGSETSKRCRELRNPIDPGNPYKKKVLDSLKEGKFEKFFLVEHDHIRTIDQFLKYKLLLPYNEHTRQINNAITELTKMKSRIRKDNAENAKKIENKTAQIEYIIKKCRILRP